MNIKALRQAKADNDAAQAKLKAEGRSLLSVAADKRTPEQETRLSAIEAQMDTLSTEASSIAHDLARAERFADDERQQATDMHPERMASNGAITRGGWEGQADDERLANFRAGQAPIVYHGLPRMERPAAMRYAFGQQLLDVFRATTRHQMSEPLAQLQAAAQGAGEKIGSDGGFMVQSDVQNELITNVFTGGKLLSAVRQISVGENSNGITMRAVDETSRATGSRWGGVNAYWVDEGTAATASKPKFRKLELRLNKLAALGYATDELLADFVALGDIMFQAFTEEVRFLVEDAIMRGGGVGQPLGILNADAKISVSRNTGSHVKHADISSMWARMHPRSKANSVWLCNTDVNPDLDALAFSGATNDMPVRYVSFDDTGVLRIKGRPVIETEYNATLGTSGDFVLVDLTQYLFIQKLLQTASSMHVAFTTDEMAFRVTWRVDGKPAWISALTPYKGSNTQSPYIVLS